MKESERVQADKHGLTALRYQNWENGKGGEQVCFYVSLLSIKLIDENLSPQVYLVPPQDTTPGKAAV